MKFQKGFSILEVLVAFVVLIIGMLGAATLIIRSSQMNVKAYETEQVAVLANTYVEKIRANSYAIDTYLKSGNATEVDCSISCSAEDRARTDKKRFEGQLENSGLNGVVYNISEIGSNTGVLLGNNNKFYQLQVDWGAGPGETVANKYIVKFVVTVK